MRCTLTDDYGVMKAVMARTASPSWLLSSSSALGLGISSWSTSKATSAGSTLTAFVGPAGAETAGGFKVAAAEAFVPGRSVFIALDTASWSTLADAEEEEGSASRLARAEAALRSSADEGFGCVSSSVMMEDKEQ